MTDDRVVITGTGLVSSLGTSSDEVWTAILRGESGIRPVEGFDAAGFGCGASAQVRGLSPQELGVNTREARIMDVHSLMLLKASRDALSGTVPEGSGVPRESIGFFAGMGMVDYRVADLLPAVLKSRAQGSFSYPSFFGGGYNEIYPLWPLSMLNNVTFCQVSILLDVRGDNAVLSPHGDSGAQAVVEALHSVEEGRSMAAVAAGVSETVNPCSLARARGAGILNTSAEGADKPCRPFGLRRMGTVIGEACGAVAFELRSSALQRGAAALGVVEGYGFACDPDKGSGGPTPEALAAAMEGALESAGLRAAGIDVIIAHGDGTAGGDENEIEALGRVFAGRLDRTALFTSKQALGHTFAAAPVLDVVLALRMIAGGCVPAAAGLGEVDPRIAEGLLREGPSQRPVARVLVNSRSYEGQAASLVIGKAAG